MTDGLYLGEVVLLVLGVVLFLVLVFAFIYQLLRHRSLKPLLLFFLVPVLMIGYPTIKSVQYKDGALTLDKMTRELAANPTDVKLREALDEKVKDVAPRVGNSPKDAVTLAQAQFELGREDEAARSLARVPASKGSLPEVRELRARLDQVERLRSLAGKVEANPGDQQSRAELQRNLAAADQNQVGQPERARHRLEGAQRGGDEAKAKASSRRRSGSP